MNFKRFGGKLLSGWYIINSKIHPSFSQAGEDQIIRYLFGLLKISNPTYLDIGANHPYIGNNTFYYYLRGSKGVCVEPDPSLFKDLKKHRSKDIILQAGISIEKEEYGQLYIFPHPYTGWNTFSKEEAENRQKETGISLKKIERVPLLRINDVMEKYFSPHPNLLSIDVEGLDLSILQSLDFEKFKPEVICVESITFSMNNQESKVNDIIAFLQAKGYFVFGDTRINSILCRTDVYK